MKTIVRVNPPKNKGGRWTYTIVGRYRGEPVSVTGSGNSRKDAQADARSKLEDKLERIDRRTDTVREE